MRVDNSSSSFKIFEIINSIRNNELDELVLDCEGLTDCVRSRCFEALSINSSITSLTIKNRYHNSRQLNRKIIACIKSFLNQSEGDLKVLGFYNFSIKVLKSIVRYFPASITDLSIVDCGIGTDKPLDAVIRYVDQRWIYSIERLFAGLEVLNLSHNEIGPSELCFLAKQLENAKLREFSLSQNYYPFDDSCLSAFSNALKVNSVLEVLRIGPGNCMAKGAIQLTEALESNNTLQVFSFENSHIMQILGCPEVFSKMIAAHLSVLHLENHSPFPQEILQYEVLELSKGWKESKLKELNLSGLLIGDVAAVQLANGLKENTSLVNLNLNHNNFTCLSIPKICDALALHSTLTHLDLGFNHLLNTGQAIASLIWQSPSLTSLNINAYGFSENDMEHILSSIEINGLLRQGLLIKISLH